MTIANVEVEGLARNYGRKRAVQNLSFHLSPGSVVGLVGANGGGKSTALKMLSGAIPPTSGQGRVLGVELRSGARRRLRSLVGYMTQHFSLFPDLTCRENLQFAAAVNDLPRSHAARALQEFDLAHLAEVKADRLSGGWKRRLHLAAALLPDHRVILLDEPTAGLDIGARIAMWTHVEHRRRQGASVIVATHDLREAERCDEVMLFFDGIVTPAASVRAIIADAGLAAFALRSDEPSNAEIAAGYIGDEWTAGARRALVEAGSAAEAQLRLSPGAREVPAGLEDVIRARLTDLNK